MSILIEIFKSKNYLEKKTSKIWQLSKTFEHEKVFRKKQKVVVSVWRKLVFWRESMTLYKMYDMQISECYLRQFFKEWYLSLTELIEHSKKYFKIIKQEF